MSKNNPHIFTSESVGEGHPDKVADYISDSILDACLAQDKTSRVACETLVKSNMVIIAGELTTKAVINPEKIARQAIREIGYCNGQDDDVFHADTVCSIRADRAEFPGRFSDTRKFSSACFSACPSFDVSCSPMSFRAAEFRQLTALSCMFHDHSAQTL